MKKNMIVVLLGLFTLHSNAEIDLMPKEDHDIMAAVRRGDQATVERILQQKSGDVNVRDGIGMTPFLLAVQRQNIPMVKTFLNHKKFVDIHAKDAAGRNALVLAIGSGGQFWSRKLNVPLIELLVDAGVDVNGRYQDSTTILMALAMTKSLPMVAKVLKAGARVNDTRDKVASLWGLDALTALAHAAQEKNAPMVKALVDAKADVNVTDVQGKTPLMIAAQRDFFGGIGAHEAEKAEEAKILEIAKILLTANPKLDLQDEHGYTALMYAVDMRIPGLVEILLEAKADAMLKDNNRETALDHAEDLEDPQIKTKIKDLLTKAAQVKK